MRKRSLAESQVQVLLRGVNLKTIESQEKNLARKALWKRRPTMKIVRGVAGNYLPDETHADQDRRLALAIFNKTKRMHSLGTKERYWLECAAILHDVGRSEGDKGHQKRSLDLILNDPSLPFTQRERYIIGSIARYHRKALPNRRHFNLTPISNAERKKVAVLSSILRVADALDYSHRSVVKRVNVKSLRGDIILECFFSRQHYLEDQAVKKRKDLFEKVFKKTVIIVWKTEPIAKSTNLPELSEASKNASVPESSSPMPQLTEP
jgi:exopolyphosphatase/guanosine-5'-triphosphate,3'-diphosphate pyrophosphatase